MTRMVVALLLATAPLAAAPLPKAKGPVPPPIMTTEGDTKVSEIRGVDGTSELTEVVAKVETSDGKIRVTGRHQLDRGRPVQSTYEVTTSGIFLVAYDGKDLPARRECLRLPTRAGDTWSWEQTAPGVLPSKQTWTVVGEEDVEVPAGKFRAVRVEGKLESKAPTLVGSYWYAPGVGQVKSEIMTSTGLQTTVLKSFKPGM